MSQPRIEAAILEALASGPLQFVPIHNAARAAVRPGRPLPGYLVGRALDALEKQGVVVRDTLGFYRREQG